MAGKILRMALCVMVLAAVAGCAGAQKPTAAAANSGIKGQVLIESEGAAGGVFVYAYESPYNDMRVPAKWISEATTPDGAYSLTLPPGSYYLVARKRITGNPKGYLVKGDYEGKYPGNPVTVKPGDYTPVNFSIVQLSGNFLLAPYINDEGGMSVMGKVTDVDGSPAAGAYVLLYKDKEMVGTPEFLSKPANKAGEYRVYVTASGTYYVAARKKYGGLPKMGEPYGTYDKVADHSVTLNPKDTVSDINIKLGPFPFDLAKPTPPADVK